MSKSFRAIRQDVVDGWDCRGGAAEIERWLRQPDPIVLAIGTGRTLKAAVDQLPPMECPQHRIVSLTGNIGPDGSAAYYNVIFSMADAIKARHFPMPLPVLCSSAEERELLHDQAMVRSTLSLGAAANVTFVGVGELGENAPLCVDGFLAVEDMKRLIAEGAAGEICGWFFDGDGKIITNPINDRVASVPFRHARLARSSALRRAGKNRPPCWPPYEGVC